jgi:stage III sporulation protein AG
MITYYSSTEKSIAYETKQNTAQREDKSEMSEDKKAVMTDGEPMVVKEVYPKVKGVIVTAEGAGDISVRKAISEAVAAALDVPAHRICIYKMKEE